MSFLGWIWFLTITMAVIALIIGLWQVYAKAGVPGWWSLIPILNIYGWMKVAGREWWWTLLYFIPVVGFVVWVISALDVARLFGRGTIFGVLLALFPYVWSVILGFGPEEYKGVPADERRQAIAS